MFSFRRKPTKSAEEPRIRGRPSLPELNSQGIPWPENLVDLNSIRDSDESTATSSPKGAAKTSFGMDPQSPISFHKPFRLAGKSATEGASISSMYMSTPPSAFDSWKHPAPVPTGKYSQRRARLPPTFNLMVRRSFPLFCYVSKRPIFALRLSVGSARARLLFCDCFWKRPMYLLLRPPTSALRCRSS